MLLYRQYFRIQRTGLLIWAGINGFLAWVLASSAKGMESANALGDFLSAILAKLPDAVGALFGLVPGISPVDNLIQAKIGFWMGIALPIYGCLLATSAVSREIDRGTADFLFALPVDRRRVLVARWSVMVTDLSIVTLVTWCGVSGGLAFTGVAGNYVGYFWMLFQAMLLGVAMGSLALLWSLWAPDYEKAMKRSLIAVLLLFAVDMGMRVAGMSTVARAFNPFRYFSTIEPLLRRGPMLSEAGALLAVSAVSLWFSIKAFSTKQIEA